MARRMRDRKLEQLWRRRLREWRLSGLTGREFCRLHGLSEPSFYGWRRELGRRDRERRVAAPSRSFVVSPRSATGQQPASGPAFVPVRVVSVEALEVVARCGRVIRVGVGFDAGHLRAVLAALEGVPC